MQWRDEGIVLSVRRHGENAAIIRLLTLDHGQHGGWVHALSRKGDIYQPGNRVSAVWRSRLSEQLGSFRCELRHSTASRILHLPERLSVMVSCCRLVEICFAERAPDQRSYHDLLVLLGALEGDHWARACVFWEMKLLNRMGFALDLSRCVVSGVDDVAYISPKTGHGVSKRAAGRWRNRLLPVPDFLHQPEDSPDVVSDFDIATGLRLSGFFLRRHLQADAGLDLPPVRRHLADFLTKKRDCPDKVVSPPTDREAVP